MAYIPQFPGSEVIAPINPLELQWPGQQAIPDELGAGIRAVLGPNPGPVAAGVATLQLCDQASLAAALAVRQFLIQAGGLANTVRIPLWVEPNFLLQVTDDPIPARGPYTTKLLPQEARLWPYRIGAITDPVLGQYVQFDVAAQLAGAGIGVIAPAGSYWTAGGRLCFAYRSRRPSQLGAPGGRPRSILRSLPYDPEARARFGWKAGDAAPATSTELKWWNGGWETAEGEEPRPLYIYARLRESAHVLPQTDELFGPYVLSWIEDQAYLEGIEAARTEGSGQAGQSGPSGQAEGPAEDGEADEADEADEEDEEDEEDPDWEAKVRRALHELVDLGRETARIEPP